MARLDWALCTICLAGSALGQGEEGRKFYYEDIYSPFFALDRDRPGLYKAVRPEASPGSFAARKAPEAFRLFVLGGSIASIHLEQPRNLGEALKELLSSRKIEALDCGMPGYDSARETLVEKEVLSYQPDLLVFMGGHNEWAGSAPLPLWILRLRDRLQGWPLFRRLSSRLGRRRPPASLQEEIEKNLRGFEANLRGNIRRALGRGVPVAVCSPPINYRESPSNNPLILPPLGFLRGWIKYLHRDWRAAQALWERALPGLREYRDKDARALSLFYLARCSERLGERGKAEKLYREALEAEPWSGCGPRCQDMIRRAALEEGAIWVDLDGVFRRAALPGLPDLRLFRDKVHWHQRYNHLVSLAISEALVGSQSLGRLPWDRQGLEFLKRRWGRLEKFEEEQASRATLREVLIAIAQASPRLSWRGAVYLEVLFERRPGWFGEAKRLLSLGRLSEEQRRQIWGVAPVQSPEASLLWHVGEARMRRGDPRGALSDFDRALGLDPALGRVRLSSALARALAGDRKGAELELRKAKQAGLGPEALELENALRLEWGDLKKP